MKYLILIGVIVLFGCQTEVKVLDRYEFTTAMKIALPASSRLELHNGVQLMESCSIPVGSVVEVEKVENNRIRFRVVEIKAGREYCGLGMTFTSQTALRMYLRKMR